MHHVQDRDPSHFNSPNVLKTDVAMEDGWWLFWGHPACTPLDHNTFRGEKEEMEVRKVFKEVEENFRLFPTHG